MAQITLEVSKDGGCTWEPSRGREVTNATTGSRHRVMWRRNGRFDQTAVFRFKITEPATIAIGQSTADMVGGE